MKKQQEMVESFQMEHSAFIRNLDQSIDILDHDINAAGEVDAICTGPWCKAIENTIDELANSLYSISEPRFVADSGSRQLSRMRTRIHDLYSKYRCVAGKDATTH